MTEEDTLGFIAADAFNRTGNWEAAASAVREKVIEECAAIAKTAHERNLADAFNAVTDDGRLIFDSAQATAYAIDRDIRSLSSPLTSGDRNASQNDGGLLETNLIHPHPRQDGQQCDHPGSGDPQ